MTVFGSLSLCYDNSLVFHCTEHSCVAIRNSCNSFFVSVVVSISFVLIYAFVFFLSCSLLFSCLLRFLYGFWLNYEPKHRTIWERQILRRTIFVAIILLIFFLNYYSHFVWWHSQSIKFFLHYFKLPPAALIRSVQSEYYYQSFLIMDGVLSLRINFQVNNILSTVQVAINSTIKWHIYGFQNSS